MEKEKDEKAGMSGEPRIESMTGVEGPEGEKERKKREERNEKRESKEGIKRIMKERCKEVVVRVGEGEEKVGWLVERECDIEKLRWLVDVESVVLVVSKGGGQGKEGERRGEERKEKGTRRKIKGWGKW